MNNYFNEFTDEEIDKYIECDFEPSDGGLHHLDCDFTVYTMNGEYYVEREETEGGLQEMDGNYYVLAPTWYMHFDLNQFTQDYNDGAIDSEAFNVEDYAI